MDTAVRQAWTREEFFGWAEVQEGRHEFDGVGPVAMTGGNLGHDRATLNILAALREKLRGGPCTPMGPNAGVGTVGQAVRYPDAVATCSAYSDDDRLVPAPVVVFEVVSLTSGQMDRIDKVVEYQSVGSVKRYVIVLPGRAGLTVHSRDDESLAWAESTLVCGDTLELPEIGAQLAVDAIYD